MTLIIQVADERYEAVRELLARTDGVQHVAEADTDDDDDDTDFQTKEEVIAGLKESIQQANDHRDGKIQLPSASN